MSTSGCFGDKGAGDRTIERLVGKISKYLKGRPTGSIPGFENTTPSENGEGKHTVPPMILHTLCTMHNIFRHPPASAKGTMAKRLGVTVSKRTGGVSESHTFRAARSLMWMLPKSTTLICGKGRSSSATAFLPAPPSPPPPSPWASTAPLPPAAASASAPPSSAPPFPCISSFACTWGAAHD